MPERTYAIHYDSGVKSHLAHMERRHHSLIRSAIEDQLRLEPDVATRNRKPLRPSPETPNMQRWELRCGPGNRFRVLYRVGVEDREVLVIAIGMKLGNRLIIGGEEMTR